MKTDQNFWWRDQVAPTCHVTESNCKATNLPHREHDHETNFAHRDMSIC